MTAQIKVKVQRKAIVKLKVLPRFPSSVTGDNGIIVAKSGGNVVISIDGTQFPSFSGAMPFQVGDLLVASSTNTLLSLPAGPRGSALVSNGLATRPSYQGAVFSTPEDFTAKGDAVRVASSSVTVAAGGTALTVAGANFAAGNVGNVITIQGAGTAGAYHTTTIATRTGATTVTITAPAVTALAAVAKEVIYGTDDTVAFQQVAAAMNAGTIQHFRHTAGKKYLVLPSINQLIVLMDLTNVLASGITYDGAHAEMIVPYMGSFTSYIFQCSGIENFTVKNFIGTAVQGQRSAGNGVNWFVAHGANRNLSFQGDVTGGVSHTDCFRDYTVAEAGVTYGLTTIGKATNTYYGVQNRTGAEGHFVDIDCDGVERAYIGYGHTAGTFGRVRSKNPLAQDVAIGAFGHNTDTRIKRTANFWLKYINTESTTTFGCILITGDETDPAVNDIITTIDNINIDLDWTLPTGGANVVLFEQVSRNGHAGTAALGDVGHIMRNIRLSGTIRGKHTSQALFKIGVAASGWGALSAPEVIITDLKIPDDNGPAINIGAYAVTSFTDLHAPSLPKPTFEGSPTLWNHSWENVLFSTGGVFPTRPFNSPTRFYNGITSDPVNILLDNNGRIDFCDGGGVAGTADADASALYFTAKGARSITLRTTDSLTAQWNIITAGHFKPVTDNAVDIGDATHRARVVYGAIGQFNTVAHGVSGTLGTATFGNATSGTVTVQPVAGALGAVTLSLPAATDTLVGKATTDTLTNKTFDTAGTGNSFSINSVAVTANTGTGAVARAASPTFTTPTLGAATATSVNKVAITAPASSATLTLTDGKTLAATNSITIAGTDGKTLTVSNNVSLAGGDGSVLAIAANKTLTASNTLTLTATDGSTLAIGTGGTLGTAAYKNTGTTGNQVPLLDGVNTWTNNQSLQKTGTVTLTVESTTTGSSGDAQISFKRADANGYASLHYYSGGTQNFSTGLRSGDSDYHFYNEVLAAENLLISAAGNVAIGSAAIATNATNGFLYIPSCAGTPTGVPTGISGRVPMVYDSTNNKFYVYNGAWKSVTLA